MKPIARPILGRCWILFERGLIEQSVAERLGKAVFLSGLLWLAIWWAAS